MDLQKERNYNKSFIQYSTITQIDNKIMNPINNDMRRLM